MTGASLSARISTVNLPYQMALDLGLKLYILKIITQKEPFLDSLVSERDGCFVLFLKSPDCSVPK